MASGPQLYLYDISLGGDEVGAPNRYYVAATEEQAAVLAAADKRRCELENIKENDGHWFERLVPVADGPRADNVLTYDEAVQTLKYVEAALGEGLGEDVDLFEGRGAEDEEDLEAPTPFDRR